MRKSILLVAVGISACPLAIAAPPGNIVESGQMPPTAPLTYRRLDDADSLENLLHANPRHYAIARRILAAADQICDAHEAQPMATRFDAKYVTCANSFWLTSNPPKRSLHFRIDDTVYSALVVATNLHPRPDMMPLNGMQLKPR